MTKDEKINVPETVIDIPAIVEKLTASDNAYESSGHPILSDEEYDSLRNLIEKHVPNHPYFEKVGHPASSPWVKGNHSIFMGSLEKIHSDDEFLKWASKFKKDTIYVLQHKLDGLSLSIDYEESKITNTITRGDAITGENIKENVDLMGGYKSEIPDFNGSIRAEVILNKENFKVINSILPEDDKYSNARNAASGISRRLDGKFSKYLTIVAYDITEPLDEHNKIERLKSLGFDVPFQIVGMKEDIVKAFEKLREERASLPFDIDGAVIKVNSHEIQVKMGITKKKPKAQKGWKFEPPGAATIFYREDWEVGRTGVVTPVANLEPVLIEGSEIKKATLHNVAEIKRLGIGRGDVIMLVKAGDIIPKITKVLTHMNDPIKIPTKCPSCESKLSNDGTTLMCENDDCYQKKFYRILNWIKVTKIDTFGESLADKLSKAGKLEKIYDIYTIQEEDIAKIEGWGKLSAQKVLEKIEKTYTLTPVTFLSALGIPGISEATSEDLIKAFGTIEYLMGKDVEEIKKLKGFADISARNVVNGLLKYKDEINNLLKIIDVVKENKGILEGFSFCFTGSLEHSRSYYQKLVTAHGGTNKKAVVKDLSYLICNEDKGSSKSRKAEKYNEESEDHVIQIVDEKAFLDMIGEILPETEPETKTESVVNKKVEYESYSLFDDEE